MLRKIEVVAMVPQTLVFETPAKDGVELTNAAHMAVSKFETIQGHQPRLAQTKVVEVIDPNDDAA